MPDPKEKFQQELEDALWRKIDWIKLLSDAISNRKTSWNENPVIEWRNASDEIRSALIAELERLKILENPLERARKYLADDEYVGAENE